MTKIKGPEIPFSILNMIVRHQDLGEDKRKRRSAKAKAF